MANRSSAGPPPGGRFPGRYLSSPRRQNARLPTSVPAHAETPTSPPRSMIDNSGMTNPSAAMLSAATSFRMPGSMNPQIAEIQNRVAELVRRYDDDVAAVEQEENRDDEDEDDTFGDKGSRTPARWKVGDVLLATHRALARTSTHTERAMISEFGDDPEVNAAIGTGVQNMGNVYSEATEQAARRHQRLLNIHQALQYVASNGLLTEDEEEEEEEKKTRHMSSSTVRERELQLKSTIEALHRENAAMTAQLQEAQRVNREALIVSEQQNQELSKTQRVLRTQSEELRLIQEANEKAVEVTNALLTSWRDKFQASSKAAAAAEAKVQELETKVRSQGEEIMKQTFVLQAKIQEMEHFKEHEAARSRAEAVAQAAALAEAEAEARRVKARALEEKRKMKESLGDNTKELRELEDKVRELEYTLQIAEDAKKILETDNNELSKRLSELQVRFGELRKSRPAVYESSKSNEPTAPASSFALKLRENTPRANARARQRSGVAPKLNAKRAPTPTSIQDDEDLPSSDSEDDSERDEELDEVEQDERELNHELQHIVAMVFPVVLTSVQSETELNESIAQYEDPARSPLSDIQPGAVDHSAVMSNSKMVPRSEFEALRGVYDNEVEVLKQQYVEGLLEYKRLVIEQYGRRQAVERERHKLEVEGLLRLIQTKFHAELGRRSDRLKRAKDALKVLYHSLRQYSMLSVASPYSSKVLQLPTNTPLRTLLRAAILTLSTSVKRNKQGTSQIAAIHDQLMNLAPVPDAQTSAIAAAMTIHSALHEVKERPADDIQTEDVECQTDPMQGLHPNRVNVIHEDQRVAIESLDGYVLPGSPCFPRVKPQPSKQQHESSVSLQLVAGIPITPSLVADLRRCLPKLPPGNYYVSSALRLTLFRELVKYYASIELATEFSRSGKPRVFECEDDQLQEAESVIGSPRDTPFLRRKAVEAIESKNRLRNRRHLFTSGGAAILQAAFTSISASCEPPSSR